MNQNFDHFVFTRFNLKIPSFNKTSNENLVISDEWLIPRFELFDTYCFPSFKHQKNTNFRWLVFFDTDTPAKFKDMIKKYQQDFPQFEPIFLNSNDGMKPAIKKILLDSKKPYVITSRIDNDDILGLNYIENIQRQFEHQDFLVVDQIDGYNLNLFPTVQLGKRRKLSNPFISLIEVNDKPVTIMSRGHSQWKNEKKTAEISHAYSWIGVIHGSNVTKKFKGHGSVNMQNLKDNFVLPDALLQELSSYKLNAFSSAFNKIENALTVAIKRIKRSYRS